MKKVFCVYVFVKENKISCLTDSENNDFVSSSLFVLENEISSSWFRLPYKIGIRGLL